MGEVFLGRKIRIGFVFKIRAVLIGRSCVGGGLLRVWCFRLRCLAVRLGRRSCERLVVRLGLIVLRI